jgi:type III secretion system YscQ/HrcQ family protein
LRQIWTSQTDVGIYAGSAEPMTWRAFLGASTSTRANFPIRIHPIGATAVLEISRLFLAGLLDHVLRPLELQRPGAPLSAADNGILEFVVLCLIERINRDAAFPFQFEAGPCGAKPDFVPDERGIALACSLNLHGTTGALRVFLPYSCLEAMHRAAPNIAQISAVPAVTWKFPLSAGRVELAARDVAGLERHDVLLFEPAFRLLFPERVDAGWELALPEDVAQNPVKLLEPRNSWRLRVDKYIERELLKTGEPESSAQPARQSAPDVGLLPVQVHVILAEKELTLSEANSLVAGTILELDCDKSGPVSLAINGRIVGEGQLVEVEGRLGVKILAWKGA